MTEKIWKVAVVGCGSFANGQYFPHIAKEANAVCVAAADVVFERAEEACRRWGIPKACHDVYELLGSCDFDIAIDAASIQAHHEINMALLSAGKHLISQKPAAPDVERLTLQIETAREKKVNFVCAPIHPMRYDLSLAREWIASGVIGNAYYAKCNMSHGGPEYFQYRDNDPSWFFEPGAGALVDMGVHGLQIVTTLFGPAKRVGCMAKVTTPRRTVRSGAFDGREIDAAKLPDQYLITLDFGEGKMALVDSGFSEKASKAPQLEIFGDRGTIAFTKPYMQNPVPEVYLDSPELGIRGWMEPMPGAHPPAKLLSQCCCLRDLIESIETGRPPRLSPEHARHVLEIMCAVPAAAEEGRLVELHTTFERHY